MKTWNTISLLIAVCVFLAGCYRKTPPAKADPDSKSKTPAEKNVNKNSPQFRATVIHFSSGPQGRVTATHEIGKDRGHYTRNTSHLTTPDGKKRFIGKFEIRFVEHRDGKDIYPVSYKVATNDEGTSTSETQKAIGFAGDTVVVFEDQRNRLAIEPRMERMYPVKTRKPRQTKEKKSS